MVGFTEVTWQVSKAPNYLNAFKTVIALDIFAHIYHKVKTGINVR